MKNRKLVNVPVSFDLLIELMREGYSTNGVVKTTEGIPEDAFLVATSYDSSKSLVYLTFYHDSFEHVPFGDVIPNKRIYHTTSTYIYNEETLNDLYTLVQENQEFFNCQLGDDKLEKAVEKLKWLVSMSQDKKKRIESFWMNY